MTKLSLMIMRCFCGAMLVAGSLFATEDAQVDQHIPVGTRMLSKSEHAAIQEHRAMQDEQMLDENGQPAAMEEENLAALEAGKCPCQDKDKDKKPKKCPCKDKDKDKKELQPKAIYTTSHIGCYHKPKAVSPLGDTVELEDGSIWSVKSSDRFKTLDWLASDTIIVTPNHSWFSTYDFVLNNQNTGESVESVLSLGPIYNGIYTHWITAIDYNNNMIWLEDGSSWRITVWDYSVISKWLINDTVIVGIWDGWFSTDNPNIMINVSMNNYARGKCLN